MSSIANNWVDVWLAEPVADADLMARYRGLLDRQESERFHRFVFDRDRHGFLVAHALLRISLSRHLGAHPRDLRLVAGENGRPELADGQDCRGLRFNLSHTASLAACAITLGRDAGIDVEWTRRTGLEEIWGQCLAESELESLQRLPAASRSEGFLYYWTLKEAYLKAKGEGLTHRPLDRVVFEIDEGPESISHPRLRGLEGASWHFATHRPTPEHILALAVSGHPDEQLDIRWRFETPRIDWE